MQCFNAVVVAFTASFLAILGSSLQKANATLNDIPKNEAGTLPNIDLNFEDFKDYPLGYTEQKTLLASTLDGTLVAINSASGEIIWELDDEPVVRSPYDNSNPVLPAFLPDPKDGSIYMIGRGLKEPLKKLPFTIPELVAASPCKSSDGILYTGKKVDTWFSVDRFTGSKQGSLTFNGCIQGQEDACPNLGPANFLIGRTEYNIMMYDSRSSGGGRKWNISYFDYSSNLASVQSQKEYNLAHFTDSSKGQLVTLDRASGKVDWQLEIGSPIVALFRVEGDGIVQQPFTSVSKETLTNLLDHFDDKPNEPIPEDKSETNLYTTLYVGEHQHGLYAMPSYVDKKTLTINPAANGPLMLEGPQNVGNSIINLDGITDSKGFLDDPFGIPIASEPGTHMGKGSILLFGYYQVPQYSTIRLSPAMTPLQLTSTSTHSSTPKVIPQAFFPPFDNIHKRKEIPMIESQEQKEPPKEYDEDILNLGLDALKSFNVTFVTSKEFLQFGKEVIKCVNVNLGQVENKELKIIVVLLCIGIYVLFRIMQKNLVPSSSFYNGSFHLSSTGSRSSQIGTMEVTALPVELDNGHIKVGNIQFDPTNILGKGCEGTFVYKGKFDNRDVAVKRVLAACFTIADREVELLRESDEHPNVIRYFCMEQDRQFRYIALEYCCATLHDYVTGKYQPTMDNLSILRQATQGLAHLHSLDIVHRDIKPHNVLISMPGKKGEVRAMISDFGLCKKLKVGRMSFSHRSGIAGTEGWIAPEMMLGNRSTTCAVDIFSLGCVYYFVLSDGHHPFGESFKRQANILAHDFSLKDVADNHLVVNLIEKMIGTEPSLRPPSSAVLKHPVFWSKDKNLTFLQDVSDRVDKEESDSAILATIERNRMEIVRGNWLEVLDEHVHEDLRKHRSYRGNSVRDLLRALRNKKHHYNELPEVTKLMYGRLPDQFTDYWTSRFPKLLIHSWMAMHCIKNEPSFAKYFDKDYDFVKTFYRENVEMKSPIKANPNNDFMPNFTTTKEPESQNASSVISQWEKLPELRQEDELLQEDEPDESFSEMKPSKAKTEMMQENNTTPVRKVVGQLKSELELRLEEAKKPQTWANAVKNEKSVINPNDHPIISDKPDQPESPDSDNKENEKELKEINEAKDESSPVWILPQEEPKKKKKKKKVKKED